MIINFSKETLDIPPTKIGDKPIERVEATKLLGLFISNDLTWDTHITYIQKKAKQRLYSLVLLKRAGVSPEDITAIYCSIIRPILEYGCQVWHGGATQEQKRMLESIQKRALRISFPEDDYNQACERTKLPTLDERRIKLCKSLFLKALNPDDKLNYLFADCIQHDHVLRKSNAYKLPKCKTDRYKNTFVPFCLYNFQ